VRRFYFRLEGAAQIADKNGCLYEDAAKAFKAAQSLACDVAEARQNLCKRTCVIVTERDRPNDLYCISIQ
jgi:hypothetical protein